MEKKFSKPVLGTHHHQKTQSGENEAESKRQPQLAQRVLLVDKPYQIKKKPKPVEKIKEPKRGLGVAKLEILRLEGKLQQMTEQLEQLQAEKENAAATIVAVPPTLPPLLPRPPQHQHQHHHQQQHQQFQVPFPPFVDPRQQYPNGMIPVPYGRFVPVGNFPAAAGAMNKDGTHPHPPSMNFVFQPMNQNGGYPGEPMNVIPNGGLIPTGNGAGFIPAGHPHEPITNMNGNGGRSLAGHPHEPITNMNRNGGVSPAGHHQHLEPNNNIMNGNGGGFPGGGEVNNGGVSNQNIAGAGNPYMFLDQQLRVQHLKLMHSARELSAIQRMQYRPPRPSKFSVQMNPVINIEEPKSKDKMVMNDSADFLELSLGSTTNIDEKIKKDDDDDEEVMEVDAFGARRRSTTSSSSAVMEYEFFPAESSDNRSSSYSGGGGGMGGSSEASTSNENTHLVDLSLKLSL